MVNNERSLLGDAAESEFPMGLIERDRDVAQKIRVRIILLRVRHDAQSGFKSPSPSRPIVDQQGFFPQRFQKSFACPNP